MKLWQKLWLLFTAIWLVVAGLNIATILAFGDEVPREKALWPMLFAVAVPAAAYLLGWGWAKLRQKPR